MERLVVRDVRCFREKSQVRLAPLTFLVGENSTGKSTLLALVRVAWDIGFGVTEPDFNEEPFQLGSYAEIAHYHGGQGKRARSFSVGFHQNVTVYGQEAANNKKDSLVLGTFSPVAGQPVLSKLEVQRGDWRVEGELREGQLFLAIDTPSGHFELQGSEESSPHALSARNLFFPIDSLRYRKYHGAEREDIEGTVPPEEELRDLSLMLRGLSRLRPTGRSVPHQLRPYAIAPIRTKPKRTYDPLRETRSPEGEHVPMLMARLHATSQSDWERLTKELADYGRESGLFELVKVKRFSGGEASPFQISVKLAGQRAAVNLVDVGYGVSQILPILVDCLVEPRPAFFLMQQPEVHLHPRAQAELGSFMVAQVRRKKQRFLIETHSDYLVDRVRLEVRRKRLQPERVALLFFERQGPRVVIHEVKLDSQGNLQGQPAGYREFFVREELELISPIQASVSNS